MTFRYKIGDLVYDKWDEVAAIVIQKRVEYGERYYRLDTGAIRHESQLI